VHDRGEVSGGIPASPGHRSARHAIGTRLLLATAFSSLALIDHGEAQQLASIADLSSLSIEQLANLEITSVSRRPEPIREAPASVFVITSEEIRRAGATSLAEALRLAPTLQVARISSSSYAITARGFNHSTGTANKLLVLIDGRTIYTPLYSGVFWDAQTVMLDDIDRIEVISGPGGTLWGANAMNGVINIVTRGSQDTQGGLINLGAGTEEYGVGARYGGRLSDEATYRVYITGFQRGDTLTASGAGARDEWEKLQGGFRVDWRGVQDVISVYGDLYGGRGEEVAGAIADNRISGGNLNATWSRQIGTGLLNAQVYYDRAFREVISGITDSVDTYAAAAQYRLAQGEMHDIVVGGEYRVHDDRFTPGPRTVFLDPATHSLSVASAFVQDEIAVSDTLDLTVGLKFEHNGYTGWEYLPNLRLAWRPSGNALLWAAVSRAVRTPSRFERDLVNPGILAKSDRFDAEDLVAYEAGVRGQPIPALALSLTGFYHDYDKLRTTEATTPQLFPFVLGNFMEGSLYGLEAWANYAVADWWRISLGATALEKDLRIKSGSRDIFGVAFAGNDPEYQLLARSLMNFSDNLELNLRVRAIGALPSPKVPAYVEAEARLGWHATENLEFWIAGFNLLHERHIEFAGSTGGPRRIERSAYAGVRWHM
jgi:iron complex outermembrane receptor protein